MGVNSLPKSVTRQRRGCDLNPDVYLKKKYRVRSLRDRNRVVGLSQVFRS